MGRPAQTALLAGLWGTREPGPGSPLPSLSLMTCASTAALGRSSPPLRAAPSSPPSSLGPWPHHPGVASFGLLCPPVCCEQRPTPGSPTVAEATGGSCSSFLPSGRAPLPTPSRARVWRPFPRTARVLLCGYWSSSFLPTQREGNGPRLVGCSAPAPGRTPTLPRGEPRLRVLPPPPAPVPLPVPWACRPEDLTGGKEVPAEDPQDWGRPASACSPCLSSGPALLPRLYGELSLEVASEKENNAGRQG